MQQTQSQISTGLRVSSAADNAAYWSIATTMKSDNGALGAVKDGLGQSAAMLNTFSAAMNKAITVVNNIKNNLVSAQQPGADTAKIQTDIKAQQDELLSIANSANFNGQNWLNNTANGAAAASTTAKLVASYNNATGVSTIDVDTSSLQLVDGMTAGGGSAGILATNGAQSSKSVLSMDATSTSDLDKQLTDVDTAIKSLTTAASLIGAKSSAVSTQQDFISALSDSLTQGVSSLVDADMNQTSTRLQALQVQQQLGIQSLSIANSNSQMILKLFG
jgi:flagellin